MIQSLIKKYYIHIIIVVITLVGLMPFFVGKENGDIDMNPNVQLDLEEETPLYIYVDIKGNVLNPGVYKIESNTRLFQLISMAGGLTDDADELAVNFSVLLKDQQVVYIPSFDEGFINVHVQIEEEKNALIDGKININTASKNLLITLPGIGEVTAQSIIDYRENNGDFITIEDIQNVSGIGENTFNEIKEFITT